MTEHVVPAGEVNISGSLSEAPVDEVKAASPEDRTPLEHLETILGSTAMIGMTLLATQRFDEAQGVELVLDFLTFYAEEQGFRSEAIDALVAARHARKGG